MADINKLRERVRSAVREYLAEEGLASPREGVAVFTVLEDAAVEVGDAVTREVLEEELSHCSESDCHCPECGTLGLRKGERRRSIETRRGPVDVTEIECYCRRCRRSFFPSVPRLGSGAGL